MFNSLKIANSFHWLLHLEKENKKSNNEFIVQKYHELYNEFMYRLERDHQDFYDNIQIQLEFRQKTVKTALDVRKTKRDPL